MAFPQPVFRQRSVAAATIAACLFVAQSAAAARRRSSAASKRSARHPWPPFIDGRSLRLADGREIKLAGIDVPQQRPAAPRGARKSPARKRHCPGRPSETADRYGRILAFAFVNGSETPVQYNLLAPGQARVAPFMQDKSLLRRRCSARNKRPGEARIGLWADPGYAVRAAGDGPAITPQRGRFSVAEGRVVSVRDSGARFTSISEGAGRRL